MSWNAESCWGDQSAWTASETRAGEQRHRLATMIGKHVPGVSTVPRRTVEASGCTLHSDKWSTTLR